MSTRAQIAVQLDTLNAVYAVFDGLIKPQTNVVITQINANMVAHNTPDLTAVAVKFTPLVLALNAAKAAVIVAIDQTKLLVPSDPLPDPPVDPPPIPSGLTLVRKPLSKSIASFWFAGATIMDDVLMQLWTDGTRLINLTTGQVTLQPAVIRDGNGVVLPSRQAENAEYAYVPGDGVYIGTQAPGAVFMRYVPDGTYTNVAATSSGSAVLFHDAPRNRLISFAGYENPDPRMQAIALPVPPRATPFVDTSVYITLSNYPSITLGYAKMTQYRADISSTGRVGLLADNNELSELDGGATAWISRPTTGTKPKLNSQLILCEWLDAYLTWCGADIVAGGNDNPTGKFHLLPRSTWAWQQLNVTLPAGIVLTSLAGQMLLSDPERKQAVLLTGTAGVNLYTLNLSGQPDPPPPDPDPPPIDPPPDPPPDPPVDPPVDPPPPGPVTETTGKIEGIPLSAILGAPFSLIQNSKHTNMASDGIDLVVSGGDWTQSATDGTWAMNLTTGVWRQLVGEPVYPTLPAPHALQDGAGFVWIEKRNQYLLWPGSYYSYQGLGQHSHPPTEADYLKWPLLRYAKGMWWLTPDGKYTHDLSLFGDWYSTTGCLFGGLYDHEKDQIIVFLDGAAGGPAVRRWDVNNALILPNLPLAITQPAGYTRTAAIYTRGKYTNIGRLAYFAGYSTDGTALKIPRLWSWHMDTYVLTELAPPPVPPAKINQNQVTLERSGTHVVWPLYDSFAELFGIYVYDPAKNAWAVDNQVPTYGNFIANSFCSLPDGRIAMAGGVFGRHQTHMWFYEHG